MTVIIAKFESRPPATCRRKSQTEGAGSPLHRSPLFRAGILAGLMGLAGWPVPGWAQDTTWTGAVGNQWQEAGNWDNGLPIISESAIIDNGDSVLLDSNAPAAPSAGLLTLSGSSHLTVSNGADLSAFQLRIGETTTGTMTVTGSGTTVTTLSDSTDIFIGSSGGTGTLNIGDGAVVTTTTIETNEVILGSVGATGTLNLLGTAGSRGVLETNRMGTPGSSAGWVNFDGGILRALQDESSFIVGATTDVTILAGGAFIDTNGNNVGIGLPIDGTGALTKQGAGILTLSGNNTYTGGTTVREGTLAIASTGSITHTSQRMVVGSLSGDVGVLTIASGGSVTNSFGTLGDTAGSQGTATVSGTLANSRGLTVGNSGTGTLNIIGSGVVSTTFTDIGSQSGSIGTVTVSSGSLTNSAALTVGILGTGTLDISGGAISSNRGIVGSNRGSRGTVTMTGGMWTIDNRLDIGQGSSGTVHLQGGSLSVANNVLLGDGNEGSGVLNLDGGTLIASQVQEGFGSGTLTFNGGTLRLTGNQANLFVGFETGDVQFVGPGGGTIDTQGFTVATARGLTGNGQLTKQGDGILTLTGNNTYTGGTTVEAGTLSLGSNSAAGTGAITTTGSVIDYANGVTIANPIVINSDTTQLQVLTGSATQSGVISETGGARPLEKIGAGTLVLSAANTYSGGTNLSEGTLVVTNPNSLGSGLLAMADGTTLGRTINFLTLDNALAINGDVTVSGTGAIASIRLNGPVSLAPGTHTITVTNEGNPRFFGEISGDAGLTISGGFTSFEGTAANTYTGLTTVLSGGRLTLNKSPNLVAIPGDLVVDSGGTVSFSARNSFGTASTVTVNGQLEYSSISITAFSIPTLLGAGTISYIANQELGTLTVGGWRVFWNHTKSCRIPQPVEGHLRNPDPLRQEHLHRRHHHQ